MNATWTMNTLGWKVSYATYPLAFQKVTFQVPIKSLHIVADNTVKMTHLKTLSGQHGNSNYYPDVGVALYSFCCPLQVPINQFVNLQPQYH